MTSSRRVFLVLAVVVVAALPGGALAAGSTAYVSVSDVTVTPSHPAPGELIAVRATVQNLASSSSALTVDKVVLERTNGIDISSERDLGTLSPGATIQVPLTASFPSTGTKRLRVTVYGTDDSGNAVEVHYPVVVEVTNDHPQLDVAASNAVATADTTANVTVSNGLPDDVRNLEVTLRSPGVTVEEPRQVRATLPAGATANFPFTVNAASAGDHTFEATLRYTTADGTRRTTDRNTTVHFAPLRDDVTVSATPTNAGSSLAIHVTNRGNAPVSNVTLSASAPHASFSTAFVSSIPPRSSRTAVVNTTAVGEDTTATVTASYDVGDRHRSATTSANITANPASMTLTGLDVQVEDGKYHVTGSASNVGLAAANSVVVSVLPGKGVQPAYPGREYFVGTVPASDFVTFDVYATADANASSIPLQVTYLANGERRTRTVEAPIESAAPTTPTGGESSGGPDWLLPGLAGLVVVAIVAGLVVLAWRNSRGNE